MLRNDKDGHFDDGFAGTDQAVAFYSLRCLPRSDVHGNIRPDEEISASLIDDPLCIRFRNLYNKKQR